MAPAIGDNVLPMIIITKPTDHTLISADTVINYIVHDPTRDSRIAMYEDGDNRLHATISAYPHIEEATDLSTAQADTILQDLLRQHQDIFGLLHAE
jgi:hypothetical protein